MFPASFVEIIEDLPADATAENSGHGNSKEATALFDFAGEEGELSFQVGDSFLYNHTSYHFKTIFFMPFICSLFSSIQHLRIFFNLFKISDMHRTFIQT